MKVQTAALVDAIAVAIALPNHRTRASYHRIQFRYHARVKAGPSAAWRKARFELVAA